MQMYYFIIIVVREKNNSNFKEYKCDGYTCKVREY